MSFDGEFEGSARGFNWKFPGSFTESSGSSVSSNDSFISQVPLPYHLPQDYDATRPRSSLNTSFGADDRNNKRSRTQTQTQVQLSTQARGFNTEPVGQQQSQNSVYGYPGQQDSVRNAYTNNQYGEFGQQFHPTHNVNSYSTSFNPYGTGQNASPNINPYGAGLSLNPNLNAYGAGLNPNANFNAYGAGLNPNSYSNGYAMGQNQNPTFNPYAMGQNQNQNFNPYGVGQHQNLSINPYGSGQSQNQNFSEGCNSISAFRAPRREQMPIQGVMGSFPQNGWNPQAPSFVMRQSYRQTPIDMTEQRFSSQNRPPLNQWNGNDFNNVRQNSGLNNSGGFGAQNAPISDMGSDPVASSQTKGLRRSNTHNGSKTLAEISQSVVIGKSKSAKRRAAKRNASAGFAPKQPGQPLMVQKQDPDTDFGASALMKISSVVDSPNQGPSSVSSHRTSLTKVDRTTGSDIQTPVAKNVIPQSAQRTTRKFTESTPLASAHQMTLQASPSTIKPSVKTGGFGRGKLASIQVAVSEPQRNAAHSTASGKPDISSTQYDVKSRDIFQTPPTTKLLMGSTSSQQLSITPHVFRNSQVQSLFLPGPSQHLASLCPHAQKPTVSVACDTLNIPFVEHAREHPDSYATGLVKISNIPYTLTSHETFAFLGRNARLIPETQEPIHIIMERVTSKTMDCFVEFLSYGDAIFAIDRFEHQRAKGHAGRLGDRHVNLEIVGHQDLMEALFSKATGVVWEGCMPKIVQAEGKYNTGFKGFVSREELVMLVKHVETPHRSPYSKDCPQRPFECLISTLTKYPWQCPELTTIGDRDAIYNCSLALCSFLIDLVDSDIDTPNIDIRLLRRMKRAVLTCSGFSEIQKDNLAFVLKMDSLQAGLPPYADMWGVFKCIGSKRGMAPDVILYYMALLREATTSSALISLADQSARGQQKKLRSPFGDVKIDYPADLATMSLAAVGRLEWDVIEQLLRKVLPAN